MAALKLSLIQKNKLENAYTYVYSTGFLSEGGILKQGASALLLTRREEAPGAYTVLVLSETGIQAIELGEDFLDRENDPILFSFGNSFGVIKAKKLPIIPETFLHRKSSRLRTASCLFVKCCRKMQDNGIFRPYQTAA